MELKIRTPSDHLPHKHLNFDNHKLHWIFLLNKRWMLQTKNILNQLFSKLMTLNFESMNILLRIQAVEMFMKLMRMKLNLKLKKKMNLQIRWLMSQKFKNKLKRLFDLKRNKIKISEMKFTYERKILLLKHHQLICRLRTEQINLQMMWSI